MPTFDELYREGSSTANSRYLTAKNYLGAFAILVEVKDFKTQVPLFKPRVRINQKTNQTETITHEDQAIADLTIFTSEEAIEADKGDVLEAVKIAQTFLAADLRDHVGGLLVKRLQQLPSNAIVWRPVEGAIVKKVGAYFDRREAATASAIAEAGDEVPEWMKAG